MILNPKTTGGVVFKPLKFFYSKKDSEDIIDQLKKLNDLYKDGVLTKEEFEKAKKKHFQ